MADQNPVFVRIDEYKDVMEVMDMVRNKIAQAQETLQKIKEIKAREDEELDTWHNGLIDVEEKIREIDEVITQPANM